MVPTVPCLFVIERRTDTWRPLVTGLVPASYELLEWLDSGGYAPSLPADDLVATIRAEVSQITTHDTIRHAIDRVTE